MQILVEDSTSDPKVHEAKVDKLLKVDRVHFMLGGSPAFAGMSVHVCTRRAGLGKHVCWAHADLRLHVLRTS